MPAYPRNKREEARKLYLTGEASTAAEIARRLHTKPHTIAAWKKEEDWDELRIRIERRAAERLVEELAGERVKLNARHFKFWDLVGSKIVEMVKGGHFSGEDIKGLDRLSAILDRMQKGQRLSRGMALDGKTEEQIRADAESESRALVDVFINLVKQHVPDEEVRDRIARGLYESAPMHVEESDEQTD